MHQDAPKQDSPIDPERKAAVLARLDKLGETTRAARAEAQTAYDVARAAYEDAISEAVVQYHEQATPAIERLLFDDDARPDAPGPEERYGADDDDLKEAVEALAVAASTTTDDESTSALKALARAAARLEELHDDWLESPAALTDSPAYALNEHARRVFVAHAQDAQAAAAENTDTYASVAILRAVVAVLDALALPAPWDPPDQQA